MRITTGTYTKTERHECTETPKIREQINTTLNAFTRTTNRFSSCAKRTVVSVLPRWKIALAKLKREVRRTIRARGTVGTYARFRTSKDRTWQRIHSKVRFPRFVYTVCLSPEFPLRCNPLYSFPLHTSGDLNIYLANAGIARGNTKSADNFTCPNIRIFETAFRRG